MVQNVSKFCQKGANKCKEEAQQKYNGPKAAKRAKGDQKGAKGGKRGLIGSKLPKGIERTYNGPKEVTIGQN
jgi:hypothetical protein